MSRFTESKVGAALGAIIFARRVRPLWERWHPDDDRPRKAIEAAQAFARGVLSERELCRAHYEAVEAAEGATYLARRAAWAAACAAEKAFEARSELGISTGDVR